MLVTPWENRRASIFSEIGLYLAVLTLLAKLTVAVSRTITTSTRRAVGEFGPADVRGRRIELL
jgi:hypothetical protein